MSSQKRQKTVPFSADGIENVPADRPVVYNILDDDGKNIYTGVAKRGRVKERLREHLPGAKDAIRGGKKVRVQQQISIADAEASEKRILMRSKPRANKLGK